MTEVIFTKYAGKCFVCDQWVDNSGPNRGYAVRDSSGWKRYCPTCSPKKIKINRILTKEGKIFMPFEEESLDYLRSIPGSWFDRKELCWHVSLKEGDRQRLLEIAKNLGLEIAPELLIEYNFKEISSLYSFQSQGVHWLSSGNLRLLADEMGLGKTIQTIMALPDKDRCAALVICPVSVKLNWKREIEKWRSDLNCFVVTNSRNFRLPGFGEVVVANYENLPDYLEPIKNGKDYMVMWPCSDMANHSKNLTIIVDEAQRVKNYKSKRSKKVKGICLNAKNIWGLTGTPLENRPEDLFGVLDALRMSNVVFGNWKRFVEYMGGYKNKWGGYEWRTPKPIVKELVRRVMLRRTRKEVLTDLPDKTYSYIKVDLPLELKEEMNILWSDTHEIIEKGELPPFEKFSNLRSKLAKSRIDSLIDIVEDHEEDDVPLVVFSAHLSPLDELEKRKGWKKITGSISQKERQQIVEEFQSGKLKGVAVSIKAGGLGITLTHAWKAVFVDMDWVPGSNAQAEDRICRIGQKSNKVEIVRMVSDHPLDVHLLELMSKKIKFIQESIGGERIKDDDDE